MEEKIQSAVNKIYRMAVDNYAKGNDCVVVSYVISQDMRTLNITMKDIFTGEQQEKEVDITRLNVRSPQRFLECVMHAKKTNDPSFFEKIAGWIRIGYGSPTTLHLGWDYDKLSMQFFMEYEKFNNGIHGGIIYHGNPQDGYNDGGSIQLTPSYGWSSHT